MTVLLLVLAGLLAVPLAIFLIGLLLATLVVITPTLTAKLFLAKLFFARPYRLIDRDLAFTVEVDIDWTLRSRYGDPTMRRLYWLLIDRVHKMG